MALDPAEAANILSNAGLTYVRVASRRIRLGDMDAHQLDLLRQSRGRADTQVFARKYAKLISDLRDLDQHLSLLTPEALVNLDSAASAVQPPPKPAPADAARTRSELSLVPFVPTAPPTVHVPDPPVSTEWHWVSRKFAAYAMFCRDTLVWRTYSRVFRFSLQAFLYLPVVLMWICLLYFFLLFTYVAQHPGVLVTGFFRLVQLIPAYSAWAGQQMFEQLQAELVASLR